jgi:hypothetical protein
MYSEPDNRHKVPHIHAEFQGEKAVFSLAGELLEGNLPNKKRKLVEAWISIHEDDLKANWGLLIEGQQSFKIPPLQ